MESNESDMEMQGIFGHVQDDNYVVIVCSCKINNKKKNSYLVPTLPNFFSGYPKHTYFFLFGPITITKYE